MGVSRLVLIGAGRAHLFVLEALARRRLTPGEAVLVAPDARQLHQAQLAAVLTGRRPPEAAILDLAALARGAGARLIEGEVTAVDAAARGITLADGTTLEFDVASLAGGGPPAGLQLPGVREHALLSQPTAAALALGPGLERAARDAGPEPLQVAVVGGGTTGVELALAARARLDQLEASRTVLTLYEGGPTLLREAGATVSERAEAVLAAHDITVRLGSRIEGVGPGHLLGERGRPIAADLVLWATGIEAPPLFRRSGLPTDPRGFLTVDEALAVPGAAGVFGAGMTVALLGHPRPAGGPVDALRQGPVLAHNLGAALGSGRFRQFRPKDEVLALLDTSDGLALGAWRGLTVHNRAALLLKDRLDRRFVARFRRLATAEPPAL